jgi:hypothetical protein
VKTGISQKLSVNTLFGNAVKITIN